MFGRGVSVGMIDGEAVADGVTGNNVWVNVSVTVPVSLGFGVMEGMTVGRISCVGRGAQVANKITAAKTKSLFIYPYYK